MIRRKNTHSGTRGNSVPGAAAPFQEGDVQFAGDRGEAADALVLFGMTGDLAHKKIGRAHV